MARTLWNVGDRESVLERFGRLQPAARPAWGSLDAPRMVTHVTDALRASLGEVTLAQKMSPLRVWPLNALIMFHLPWPKNAPTAPELLTRVPATFTDELDTLRLAIDCFARRDTNAPWSPHAVFGRLTGDQWGRLLYRHFDHHLTQFGL